MPCLDGGRTTSPSEIYLERIEGLEKHIAFIEATLYHTLNHIETLGGDFVHIAGIDPEKTVEWLEKFKEKERIRKEKEEAKRKALAERRNRAKIKAAAIAKLTPEELRALGIK